MTYREARRALSMAGSEDRAACFVEIGREVEGAGMLRELLIDYWTITEAWGGAATRHEMFELLRRVGYLTDTDGRPEGEGGVLTIYRGNIGEDPREGHAWTLSVEVAQLFARLPFTGRGWFLGLGRDGPMGDLKPGAIPTVWSAYVEADEILGYFEGRDEQEVVVDPETLFEVEIYQQAVAVES